MHRHIHTKSASALPLLAATLAMMLVAPLTSAALWTAHTAGRLRDEEDGVSEVVSGLLLAGGLALIVVVVLGIIQPWAETEANNLPTSGN